MTAAFITGHIFFFFYRFCIPRDECPPSRCNTRYEVYVSVATLLRQYLRHQDDTITFHLLFSIVFLIASPRSADAGSTLSAHSHARNNPESPLHNRDVHLGDMLQRFLQSRMRGSVVGTFRINGSLFHTSATDNLTWQKY